MIRSVFKSGNSLMVALPSQLLDDLHLKDGSEVDVLLSADGGSITITPAGRSGVTPEFAQKVDEFIRAYRPALDALSQR